MTAEPLVPPTTHAAANSSSRSTNPVKPTRQNPEPVSSLAPLCNALANCVKCPICLEYMEEARQLQCGHLFCQNCISRILSQRKVRCAMCKQPTTKRMVRSAPLPYGDIVRTLRVLEDAIEKSQTCHAAAATTGRTVVDGITIRVNEALHHLRTAQIKRRAAAQRAQEEQRRGHVTSSKDERPPTNIQKETSPPLCILCPKTSSSSSTTSSAPSPSTTESVTFGKLVAVPVKNTGRIRHVHENCAFFSEDVYALDNTILNIDRILRKTEYKSCAREGCSESNPTVKCAVETCDRWMHYSCAVDIGCEIVEDGYKMFCTGHKDEAPKIGRDFEDSLTGANDSLNKMHDNYCFICRTGGKLLMCDTCERCTHAACSNLKQIPIGDWSCGVCTETYKLPTNPSAMLKGLTTPQGSVTLKRPRLESLSFNEVGMGSCVGSEARPASQKRLRRMSEGRRLVIAHTGLKGDQSEVLMSLVKGRRTTVKTEVDDKVNYVVIGANSPEEVPTRTMKLCFAVARKIPILTWSWVRESVRCEGIWSPIDRHVHRLTVDQGEPGVFEGKRFCFACFSGDKTRREQLGQLVRLAGGTVVQRGDKEDGIETLYVRGEDASSKRARGAKSRFEPPNGAKVVPSSWILDQLTKERLK